MINKESDVKERDEDGLKPLYSIITSCFLTVGFTSLAHWVRKSVAA